MTTSLKILEKEGLIDHLQSNAYHMVQTTIVKIGPADPQILRLGVNKSGMTQNWLPWQRPLRYWKKFRYIIYTQNAFIWCKIAKITHGCVLLATQKWLPWQRPLRNRKNWTGSRKFMQIPSTWWKIVKIGPVDTEIALLIIKKNKEADIKIYIQLYFTITTW